MFCFFKKKNYNHTTSTTYFWLNYISDQTVCIINSINKLIAPNETNTQSVGRATLDSHTSNKTKFEKFRPISNGLLFIKY